MNKYFLELEEFIDFLFLRWLNEDLYVMELNCFLLVGIILLFLMSLRYLGIFLIFGLLLIVDLIVFVKCVVLELKYMVSLKLYFCNGIYNLFLIYKKKWYKNLNFNICIFF